LPPVTTTASLSSGDHAQQTITLPCQHSDQAYDIAVYMAGEIRKNVVSTEAQSIRDNNNYSATRVFEKFQADPDLYDWVKSAGEAYFIIQEKKAYGAARTKWAWLVKPKGDWDHKGPIARRFVSTNNSTRYHHKYQDFEYFYDIWSNIHYGYVGRDVGFSAATLLDGAGTAQVISDAISLGREVTDRSSINGDGHRRYDDTTDQLSVQLGMDLYQQYPDAAQLTADVLMAAITQVAYEMRPASKLRHRCGPHHD